MAHSTLNIMNGVKVRLQYDLSPGQKVAYRFVPVLHLNGLRFKKHTILLGCFADVFETELESFFHLWVKCLQSCCFHINREAFIITLHGLAKPNLDEGEKKNNSCK